MEEGLKNRIILIMSVLVVILFVTTINSCSQLQKQRREKEKEIASRMELEEKLSRFSQDKIIWEDGLNKCNTELKELKEKLEAKEKALSQAELITQSLREELDKVTKLKEALEEDLKEALTSRPEKKK